SVMTAKEALTQCLSGRGSPPASRLPLEKLLPRFDDVVVDARIRPDDTPAQTGAPLRGQRERLTVGCRVGISGLQLEMMRISAWSGKGGASYNRLVVMVDECMLFRTVL